MFEETIVKDQHGEEDRNESSTCSTAIRSDSAEFPPTCHGRGVGIGDLLHCCHLLPLKTCAHGTSLSPGPAAPDNNGDHEFEIVQKPFRPYSRSSMKRKHIWPQRMTGRPGVCVPNTGQMRYIAGYDPATPPRFGLRLRVSRVRPQLCGHAWETEFKSRF